MKSLDLSDLGVTIDELKKLYERHTINEMVKIFKTSYNHINVSYDLVRRLLHKYKIPLRKGGVRSLSSKIGDSILKIKLELEKYERKDQINIFNKVRKLILDRKEEK